MWVVGIDEAGYGPNLGPLVQTAVGLYLPDDDPAGWDALKAVVRRAHEPADGRLLIDDSKKAYARGGLAALERSAYGLTGIVPGPIGKLLAHTLPETRTELRGENWFDPDERLPLVATPGELEETLRQWTLGYTAGAWWFNVSVVPAPRFNRMVDASGSKGTVLAHGLVSLLTVVLSELGRADRHYYPDAPVAVLCDKQGGRNFYAAIIQQAFPDGWVVAERESAAESRYRVDRLDRPVTVTFRPRADGDSVAVALASMVAKYLREVCMRQFNRFWATHVPGLAPTTGYPVDAKRFYAAIRPAMDRLGLAPDQVWRKR